MDSFRVTDFKKPPELCQIDMPQPARGQVLVDIQACGLNFGDMLMAKGTYQDTPNVPFTLGMELAGIVTELGAGTQAEPAQHTEAQHSQTQHSQSQHIQVQHSQNIAVGARVMVYSGQGGLAQYGVFNADQCLVIPDTMSFEDAAALQITYGTSHMALAYKARLQPGETLLVLGAAGGVGLTAVEVGKMMGATVIACARGTEKLEKCKAAGADYVIDAATENLREVVKSLGGADVVYDAVGGSQFNDAFRACNPDARILLIGFASGELPEVRPNHMLVKNITLIGFYWGAYLKIAPQRLFDSLREILRWYGDGKIKPHISHCLPLDQVEHAYELMRSRKSTGKIVMTQSSPSP